MDEFQFLYDSEDFSVLLPNYLADTVSNSVEVGENEFEDGEDIERSEDSDNTSSVDYNDVLSNQAIIIEQLDYLNSNLCILNDNLISVHDKLLYLIGVTALLLFFTLVNFAIRILNNTLGLGKV